MIPVGFRSIWAFITLCTAFTGAVFLTPSASATTAIPSSPPQITLPDTVHSSERLDNLPGLSNVGRVAPGVLRGTQPFIPWHKKWLLGMPTDYLLFAGVGISLIMASFFIKESRS